MEKIKLFKVTGSGGRNNLLTDVFKTKRNAQIARSQIIRGRKFNITSRRIGDPSLSALKKDVMKAKKFKVVKFSANPQKLRKRGISVFGR